MLRAIKRKFVTSVVEERQNHSSNLSFFFFVPTVKFELGLHFEEQPDEQ